MINKFLSTKYKKGGRDGEYLDCYGLVRLARVELFGKQLMPILDDAQPANLRSITRAVNAEVDFSGFKESSAIPGSIATAWVGCLCAHVGIVVFVDGMNFILETDEPTGPCLTSIKSFKARYSKVIFYDN